MILLDVLSHKHDRPEIMFTLFLLPPMRVTATTGTGYLLILLDKLNLFPNFRS